MAKTPHFEKLHRLNFRAFMGGAITKSEEMEIDGLLDTMEARALDAIKGIESILVTTNQAIVPESGLGLSLNALHLLTGTKPFSEPNIREVDISTLRLVYDDGRELHATDEVLTNGARLFRDEHGVPVVYIIVGGGTPRSSKSV